MTDKANGYIPESGVWSAEERASFDENRQNCPNYKISTDYGQRMSATVAALVAALQHTTDAFVEHLSQEAHDKNVTVKVLCSCYGEFVEQSRALLEALK